MYLRNKHSCIMINNIVNRVMVVCPLSTVLNWEIEFRIWLPGDTFTTLNVCELASSKTSKTRETKIKKWLNIGGVLILGLFEFYTMVQFVKPGQLGTKAEFRKRFAKPLEKGQAVDSTPEDVRVKRCVHTEQS
ncbi:hypothetical protein OUZ56_003642 [Daphnia magna]|uniref:Uncharacterized protein n=1 Tax=Daphnia magna TaxID=35525 RepID=A0ABR0A9R5_9CRUS|nr:hypothetical protein OUZ56_003642 [Daphnia magna]